VLLARASASIAPVRTSAHDVSGVQVVRGYYAALNRFMQTGDVDDLAPYIEDGLATWESTAPAEAHGQRLLPALLATQSAQPGLRYDIDRIDTEGDLLQAHGQVVSPGIQNPLWLRRSAHPDRWAFSEAFRVMDDQIVEHAPAGHAGTSFIDLVPPGAQFRVEHGSSIVLSRATITPSDDTTKYATIPGPGLLLVERGTITVTGNGLIQTIDPGQGRAVDIAPGVVHKVRMGGAIVIPRGNAVVQVSGDREVSLLVISVIPRRAEPVNGLDRNEGDRDSEGMKEVLQRADPGPQSVWFGAVELLVQGREELAAGWFQMEIGWIAIAPGASASLERGQVAMAWWASGTGLPELPATTFGRIELLNRSDTQRLIYVATASPM
jgi:hypothetical protein